MKPTVLIATPTHIGKHYCFVEWFANVQNIMDYYGREYVSLCLADNTPRHKTMNGLPYHRVLNRFQPDSLIGVHFDEEVTIQERLAASHNALAEIAYELKVDYMLHLESDIFPPVSIIDDLLRHSLPIVCAPYFSGTEAEQRLIVSMFDEPGHIYVHTRHIRSAQSEIEFMGNGLREVHGAGIGCALIRHDVYCTIPFRFSSDSTQMPDTHFANDLAIAGFKNHVDTDLLPLRHENQNWNLQYEFLKQFNQSK